MRYTIIYIYIYIYSYNHSCNRIDTIQTMRLKSWKPQLSHNCFSCHSNYHLISSRWHHLITWWRSTNYSIKTMRITNAFNETMCISFNETVCFNNCYNFKRDTCCWTWVEPEPPFLCAWTSSSTSPLKRQGEESTRSLERKARKGGVGKGLVKISAKLSVPETNPILRSLGRTP